MIGIASGGMGGDGRLLCFPHSDFFRGPQPRGGDGLAGSFIRAVFSEQRQHAFRAIRRPCREQTVVTRLKRSAAMRCYKTLVPHVMRFSTWSQKWNHG